jgi:tRNA (mo5U34)-methyltransferase
MTLVREKRLNLGHLQVAVGIDADGVEQIRRSLPYRGALRPALRYLRRLTTSANGHHASGSVAPVQPDSAEAATIRRQIEQLDWYHTLDLPHGVSTPGFVDHRSQVPFYGFPDSMHGLRALDVATWDGFWAFEMERRGADVLAIDIPSWYEADIPRLQLEKITAEGGDRTTGSGFALAHKLLGSRVRREPLSVYELTPERAGTFDVVLISDLLIHLRDPQRALESAFSVTRPGGLVIVAEPYNPDLEAFRGVALTQFLSFAAVTWWMPSTTTLRAMMQVAGLDVRELARFRLKARAEVPIHKVVLHGRPAMARATANSGAGTGG